MDEAVRPAEEVEAGEGRMARERLVGRATRCRVKARGRVRRRRKELPDRASNHSRVSRVKSPSPKLASIRLSNLLARPRRRFSKWACRRGRMSGPEIAVDSAGRL